MNKTNLPIQGPGSVRIIGGQFRGKKLSFLATEGLRPTTDRIRETLFNWLMHDLRDARCLDLFAGSGALGFEALSRGAAEVYLIEAMPKVFQCLKTNALTFPSDKLQLIQMRANDFLDHHQHHSPPFDIVFVDPPFNQPALYACIQRLQNSPILREGGLLYLESSDLISLDSQQWQVLKIKKTGQVHYALYQKIITCLR